MPAKTYQEQINIKNTEKLRELTANLPDFLKEYFIGIDQTTASRTKTAYAYDLGVFFYYLRTTNSSIAKYKEQEIPLSILEQLKPQDIEEYLQFLKYYKRDDIEYTNDERGIARKLSAVKSMYNYFAKLEKITYNPAAIVKAPKLHNKAIIRLDPDEVSILLDEVEKGDKLTPSQQKFHAKTKIRDLALMTLLLGTGMRVSECVGINLKDVDFHNSAIKITRKGGSESIIYFGTEVENALRPYYEERMHMLDVSMDEQALFLSLQKKRMSVRSVEKLVKKYAQLVTTVKKITPHKLRSTYGTSLYQETGDIYLVADVLGHKDVNTTKKHYASLDETRRRNARNIVKLREDAEK